jgi:3-methylcrotonyl-CoA carboxylase alpha subunit/acetyl-CoA/propionyl-CoA carboxylase biotin carboxyl carrier protein
MTFSTLLVANRGEIALRIIRAARGAGLRTVAVYSDADADAPHVRAADAAERIGPAPAAQSYLSIPALLAAAGRSGADAVHPGYGFLSERSSFASACAEAGLVFVGPPADVIEQMGRKDIARRAAVLAGVPVLPAVEGGNELPVTDLVDRAAAEIGFPLLVKAAAGGGGKGMRIVRAAADLPAAVAAARREASAAFGDDTLLVERYVEHGRHIEVQILADTHGTVLHLFERDCSVQRRHQKVIEEAPAVAISDRVRDVVTGSAVRLARQVGYVNAGTVEFLVSGDDAYLLEMNTRLQVEHPVTEFITGKDLVALQLLVARGLPLPFDQDDVAVVGHAIEARVYAEDPNHGFLPQAGLARTVQWPARARVDAALESGQRIGTWYDPMLGKIVVHGATRESARRALVDALDGAVIIGLPTNLGFLRRLADSAAFARSEIDTSWLDRNPNPVPPGEPDLAGCAAGWAVASALLEGSNGPFGRADGWRSGAPHAPTRVLLAHGPAECVLSVDLSAGVVRADWADDRHHEWTVRSIGVVEGGELLLEVDGQRHRFTVEIAENTVDVSHQGQVTSFRRPDGRTHLTAAASDGQITAPMPGTVSVINTAVGARVGAGDVLGVLEAMKMEHALAAPLDGVVTRVDAEVGAQVVVGQPLFTIIAEPAEPAVDRSTLPAVRPAAAALDHR